VMQGYRDDPERPPRHSMRRRLAEHTGDIGSSTTMAT
jgi:hypothetical protein